LSRRGKGLLLAFIGLAAVVGLVSLAVVLSHGVEKGTIVKLTISGDIVEERDESLRGKIFQGPVTLVSEIRSVFDTAAADDSVDGMIVNIKDFSLGPGGIQELRDAVHAFQDTGKWTKTYMETAGENGAGNWQYMLASAFQDLTMAPAGDVNLTGVIATVGFFRGTLDKIGVYPDFDAIGAYKSAKDVYTEKGFTDAHREALTDMVGDLYAQLVDAVAEGRGKSLEDVEALVDRGPFTAEEALAEGLVDHLAYYDEFLDAAEEKAGGKLKTLGASDYLDRRAGFNAGASTIAVIHATGVIHRGTSGYDPSVGLHMGSDTVAKALREARKNAAVKAVILRVDSPGGSALASDIIWGELKRTRQDKPVVASYGSVAASGGYYISCGADRIVAEPATLTGSIGVVYGKFVKKELFDWLGLTFGQIQKGKNADLWTDLKRWDPKQKEDYFWKFTRKIYDQFLDRVADGRKMTTEDVDQIGQGRVWTGREAKERGLVDELGGFAEAVRAAKELAQIPDDAGVRFLVLPEQPSWWESLWSSGGSARLDLVPPSMRKALVQIQPAAQAAILADGPALLMPVGISPDN